jgi:hypothetical protein
MGMRWWRLLAVPVAAALIVVGCAVGGGRNAPTQSTTVVVPPATTATTARAGGPLVGVVSSDNLATELARLDPRTLRPLPGGRLKLAGTWPMLAVAQDRSVAVLGNEEGTSPSSTCCTCADSAPSGPMPRAWSPPAGTGSGDRACC